MRTPKKPSGHCHNGHCQITHGFIDSGGDWRCRECRRLANQERDYWKLVNRLIADESDTEALEKLQRYHESRHASQRMIDLHEKLKSLDNLLSDAAQLRVDLRRAGMCSLTLTEAVAEATLFAIDEETKHLKDELVKNAGTKKLLIVKQEDKKIQEAERRKENFEKWLQQG